MRALEFKTRIKNNQILIPSRIQTELKSKQNQVRVILLVEDSETNDQYDGLEKILNAIEPGSLFSEIKDPVEWQKQIRDEW